MIEYEPKQNNAALIHKKCYSNAGLEELKIWEHVFSCTPIQVCIYIMHAADFVHMDYLCVHACTQIMYTTMYVIMYFT